MSMVDEVAAVLAQIKDEQLSAAIQQANEHQYSPEGMPLDLETAAARLRAVRDQIQQALSGGSFVSLPPTIQRELLSLLTSVSSHITGLVSGEDTLAAFVADTDALDAYAWRNRIADHTQAMAEIAATQAQFAGLVADTQKLKEDVSEILAQTPDFVALTQQAQEAATATTQSQQTAQGAQEQVVQLVQQAAQAATSAAEAQQTAQAASEQAAQAARQSSEAADAAAQARAGSQEALQAAGQSSQQAQTAQTEATERSTNIGTLLGQAQTSRQQIAVFEAELKALQDAGDEFRQKMADTESQAKAAMTEARQSADNVIVDNTQRTETLLTELRANEDRIKDALQKATGVSLFHSFQERRNQVGRAKWIWAFAAFAAAGVTIYIALRLALTCQSFTPPFFFKLVVAVPITLVVWFCIAQYNRERRLEEEYAFKSNISLSLVPYKDLVEGALKADDVESKAKYAQFLIGSVDKVFTAPADHRDEAAPLGFDPTNREKLKEFAELFAQMVHIALQGKK